MFPTSAFVSYAAARQRSVINCSRAWHVLAGLQIVDELRRGQPMKPSSTIGVGRFFSSSFSLVIGPFSYLVKLVRQGLCYALRCRCLSTYLRSP